ncbi:MAG: NADP-dependent glyceraldehyde-3-phosphate dehydrogenase [Phycisphaerae bacterium]|nr:NADP-dependent glyceraldehyde-3-phosphate dehydrogenase [Phycisphaerae bacterium]
MSIAEQLEQMWVSCETIPAEHRLDQPIEQREYLINGELRNWSGPMQTVLSPIYLRAGSEVQPATIGRYPLLSREEALEAVQAAVRAYGQGQGYWPTLPVGERIKYVEEFARRMKERRTEVVRLLMWEIGKSYPDSAKEFDRTVEYIRDTIDALKELDRTSSRFTVAQGIIGQIRRAPLGVVLCMGPYNYPLNETFTTMIPALIMGNTVVFKPPKIGVLLHQPLLELFRDCFPPGVVNTVYGEGQVIIGPLLSSGLVDVLAFIGSCRVADLLKKQHPQPHRLRSVLGMDAKNAAIVLPSADLDLAVEECLLGSLSFNGQRCTAIKMIWVHRLIADDFISRFGAQLDKWKFGLPWNEGVRLTPLPEANKPQKMAELVADALQDGATLCNRDGGATSNSYYHPAVIYPVSPATRLYREEQFGPVVPVQNFLEIDEPIRYVVDSSYGQQVSLFGSDVDMLAELIDPLVNQVCRVNINSQCQRGPDIFPFTGRKDSAEGTLSVSDALRVFSIRTLVAAKDHELNKRLITDIVRTRQSNFLSTDFIL